MLCLTSPSVCIVSPLQCSAENTLCITTASWGRKLKAIYSEPPLPLIVALAFLKDFFSIFHKGRPPRRRARCPMVYQVPLSLSSGVGAAEGRDAAGGVGPRPAAAAAAAAAAGAGADLRGRRGPVRYTAPLPGPGARSRGPRGSFLFFFFLCVLPPDRSPAPFVPVPR